MNFLEACNEIKSAGKWDEFLSWFVLWFENNMENEESVLEHTTILYADALKEM